MSSWAVEARRGTAQDHHACPLPEEPQRSVWVCTVDHPALVLGSAQPRELVDDRVAELLGIQVVKRRSGGGAVLVVPGEVAWVDVILPVGDPLWDDDVSRSGLWLGRLWQAALDDLGLAQTKVHTGPLSSGRLGRKVCFGAVGPGEVTLDDRKLVGVSQRRKRRGARFQCAVYRRWEPELLARLLRLNGDDSDALLTAAAGTGVAPTEVVDAFLAHLPG